MTSSPAAASSSSWMRLSPDLLWTDDGLRSAASSCHRGERFFKGALPGRAACGLVGGAQSQANVELPRGPLLLHSVEYVDGGGAGGGSRAAAREDSGARGPNLSHQPGAAG